MVGARHSDEIVQREVFGPVVSITRFSAEDDAVAWANDSEYGLRSHPSGPMLMTVGVLRVAARLQYGCTWINTHFMMVSEMPHGGFKRSGYGKDLSVYALEDYSVPRHVMLKLEPIAPLPEAVDRMSARSHPKDNRRDASAHQPQHEIENVGAPSAAELLPLGHALRCPFGRCSRGGRGGDALGNPALQEIVVTATRREESISKVPISVTALTQDDLDQKGIRDFSEMVRFTPGVSIDTSGTNAISIRGISTSGGAGTTGIYIDDTPIQMRSIGFNPDDALPKTFDMERVEVLRGPQGTLFGAGSEGGTVRYIMAQPSLTTDSTYVRSELSYTQHGDPSYEAGIAQGGPIIDGVLGFRASVWSRHDGGWINRVDDTTGAITEANANYTNTEAARFALLYQPADNVHITGSIYYQNELQHDWSTYWPTYSNPGAGEFNDATRRTQAHSGSLLSAGPEGQDRFRSDGVDFGYILFPSRRDIGL